MTAHDRERKRERDIIRDSKVHQHTMVGGRKANFTKINRISYVYNIYIYIIYKYYIYNYNQREKETGRESVKN